MTKNPSEKSSFFAIISRLRYIQRWGVMRSHVSENVMEHSFETATIAFALGVIRNKIYGGSVNPYELMAAAIFHDAAEAVTGETVTPIKYAHPTFTAAHKMMEAAAQTMINSTLPAELQPEFQNMLIESNWAPQVKELVKAADVLSALFKCHAEIRAHNTEFEAAAKTLAVKLENLNVPEATYFLATFKDAFNLPLDSLLQFPEITAAVEFNIQQSVAKTTAP